MSPKPSATAAALLFLLLLWPVYPISTTASYNRGDIMEPVASRGVVAFANTVARRARNPTTIHPSTSPRRQSLAPRFWLGRSSPLSNIPARRFLSTVPDSHTSPSASASASAPAPAPAPAPAQAPEKEVRSVLPPSREADSVAEIMSTPDRSLYEKLVRRLYMTNLFHPVKMGLKNIEDLHEALGGPLDDPSISVVHIAGTNGKGSVALKTARSLELAGNRVGLFASPHVSSFRERMSIDGVPITEEEVEYLLPRVYRSCEENDIPATFFEVTTALAFLYFREGGCDAVVLETGLGGRLDATNVVKSPRLCVITSIGLEHTRILGETIPEIAREKGGIIKRDRPVLVGPHCPHDVLRECADEKGAGGYYTCDDVLGDGAADEDEEGGVVDYDSENARIATAALELLRRQVEKEHGTLALPTADQIRRGTSQRPPCRFEQVRVRLGEDRPTLVERGHGDGTGGGGEEKVVTVVLDVAHNPDAMRYLASKLKATYPDRPKRIVAGFSSDKDLGACGDALLSVVGDDPSRLHLVEAAHPRAALLEGILRASPELRNSNFDEADRTITAQVRSALGMVADNEDADEVLVVCGSVFLMAEAREALGYDEPRDSDFIAEMAGANLRHGQENFGNVDPEKRAAKESAKTG